MKKILIIILIIIVVGLCICFVSIGSLFYSIRTIQNVSKYPELRTQWEDDLVSHFPKTIPITATLKKFSYAPAFMQGGSHIQLRLVLPSEEIDKLYKDCKSKCTQSFFGGNSRIHMNMKDGMPTTYFRTSNNNKSFTEDYEIMIFDPVLRETDRPKGFYWNHAKCHGVVISKEKNEIIYWAEKW